MIDLHCHILPGLDDGAQSIEEALEMVKMAEKDGIEKIVATPHLFRNNFIYKDLGIVEEKRRELVNVLDENNFHLEVLLGAEVHISHNLIDEIRKNKEYLVLNQSSYMFVEFPPDHVFLGIKNLFFELMSEEISPIITHPERNSVFVRNPELLYELIQMGGLSQANSGSFSGLYGIRIQEAACRFLESGFIHFVASDCHNTHSLPPRLSGAVSKAAEIVGEKNAFALVRDNPKAVLDNKELIYYPQLINPEQEKKSFNIKIPHFFKLKK